MASRWVTREASRDHVSIISIMSRESRHMDETSEVTRYITERDTSSEQSIPTPKVKKSQSRNYSKHDFESVEEEVITCICANILSRINEASTDKYSPVKQYSLFDRGITRGKLVLLFIL